MSLFVCKRNLLEQIFSYRKRSLLFISQTLWWYCEGICINVFHQSRNREFDPTSNPGWGSLGLNGRTSSRTRRSQGDEREEKERGKNGEGEGKERTGGGRGDVIDPVSYELSSRLLSVGIEQGVEFLFRKV